MSKCLIGDYFTRLKKSSKESVENILEFNDYNKYMHVERSIEKELEDIILKNKDKHLILLCGSVGDGKSHVLSYLKNELNILEGYTIYNDATESFSPDYDCVKNLSKVLSDFSDININNGVANKVIIAINLGTLSNFLSSQESDNYSQLKKYVDDTKILNANEVSKQVDSKIFSHVNFTDYKIFSLVKGGCKSDFIQKLFAKVFDKTAENKFYQAYMKCSSNNCAFKEKCILRMNYEYCLNKEIHDAISKYIIEIIVKNKIIISTRQLLNIIYDIVVPANFNIENIVDNEKIYKNIEDILDYSTPSLLFEHPELSNVFESLASVDPVLYSSEYSDGLAIEISAIDNLVEFISNNSKSKNVFSNYILQYFQTKKTISKNDKLAILRNLIRCNSLSEQVSNDVDYNEFIKLLYAFYSGKKEELQNLESLYNYIRNGIMNWYGVSEKNGLCQIKLSDSDLSIFESINVDFDPIVNQDCSIGEDNSVEKFMVNLDTRFKVNGEHFFINVDYNLYNLVKKMSNGYRPNVDEKSKCISFSNIVDEIIHKGDYSKSIVISDKSTGCNYSLAISSFGGFSIRKEN